MKKCFRCWLRRSHYHLPLVPCLQARLFDNAESLFLLRIFIKVIRGYLIVIVPLCAPSNSLMTKIVIVGIISQAFPTRSEEPVNANNDSRSDRRSPEYWRYNGPLFLVLKCAHLTCGIRYLLHNALDPVYCVKLNGMDLFRCSRPVIEPTKEQRLFIFTKLMAGRFHQGEHILICVIRVEWCHAWPKGACNRPVHTLLPYSWSCLHPILTFRICDNTFITCIKPDSAPTKTLDIRSGA